MSELHDMVEAINAEQSRARVSRIRWYSGTREADWNWVRDRFVFGGRAGGGKTLRKSFATGELPPKIVIDPRPERDDRVDALAYAFAKASDAMAEPWKPVWTAWDEAPPRRWYDGLLWWLGFKRYA